MIIKVSRAVKLIVHDDYHSYPYPKILRSRSFYDKSANKMIQQSEAHLYYGKESVKINIKFSKNKKNKKVNSANVNI